MSKPIDEPLTEVRCAALLQLTSFHPAFSTGRDERGWYWEIVGGWRCRTITEVLENLNQWQLTANRVEQKKMELYIDHFRVPGPHNPHLKVCEQYRRHGPCVTCESWERVQALREYRTEGGTFTPWEDDFLDSAHTWLCKGHDLSLAQLTSLQKMWDTYEGSIVVRKVIGDLEPLHKPEQEE